MVRQWVTVQPERATNRSSFSQWNSRVLLPSFPTPPATKQPPPCLSSPPSEAGKLHCERAFKDRYFLLAPSMIRKIADFFFRLFFSFFLFVFIFLSSNQISSSSPSALEVFNTCKPPPKAFQVLGRRMLSVPRQKLAYLTFASPFALLGVCLVCVIFKA